MYVDDEPDIREIVQLALGLAGNLAVHTCESGERALALMPQLKPDLVLLDVMMPGKNGWEVAKELRSDDDLKHMGIVMLTAIGEKVNELTSPLYGADAYVDKPFDFNDLEKKIKAILEERASLS
jgi:DNA-binding response OmpR family regulator